MVYLCDSDCDDSFEHQINEEIKNIVAENTKNNNNKCRVYLSNAFIPPIYNIVCRYIKKKCGHIYCCCDGCGQSDVILCHSINSLDNYHKNGYLVSDKSRRNVPWVKEVRVCRKCHLFSVYSPNFIDKCDYSSMYDVQLSHYSLDWKCLATEFLSKYAVCLKAHSGSWKLHVDSDGTCAAYDITGDTECAHCDKLKATNRLCDCRARRAKFDCLFQTRNKN